MIHYVVAMGPPGSCQDVGRQLRSALEGTTTIGGPAVQATSPSGTWAMQAIAVPDALVEPRWHVDGEHLVVGNGTVTGDPRAVAAARGARAVPRRRDRRGDQAVVGHVQPPVHLPRRGPHDQRRLRRVLPALLRDRIRPGGRLQPVQHGGRRPGPDRVERRTARVGHRRRAHLRRGRARGGRAQPPGGTRRAGAVGSLVPHDRGPRARRLMPPPGTGEGRPDLTSSEWDAVTDDLLDQVGRAGRARHPALPAAVRREGLEAAAVAARRRGRHRRPGVHRGAARGGGPLRRAGRGHGRDAAPHVDAGGGPPAGASGVHRRTRARRPRPVDVAPGGARARSLRRDRGHLGRGQHATGRGLADAQGVGWRDLPLQEPAGAPRRSGAAAAPPAWCTARRGRADRDASWPGSTRCASSPRRSAAARSDGSGPGCRRPSRPCVPICSPTSSTSTTGSATSPVP